ncbi:DUF4136 domain-containing protein [Endozoicomonas ascidiicola]|uniref:DUF4136 domain-containing protein n=1 Tax=Endozoicomonas ascidiicola TaxID=1698521 RepID=UPI00082EBD20|nr:DUF4136 domain-containing protein [Endozoicomonas ascidiicola]
MKYLHTVAIAALILFVSGCAVKPDVSWDYNHQVDWAVLNSWAWFSASGDEKNNRILSLMAQRVHDQVSQDLAGKGLKQVPADKAQLWLGWGFTEKSKLQSQSYGGGFYYAPYPWYMSNWPSEVVVNSYEVGRLTLNVIDPTNRRVIWQGIASQRLTSDMSPEEQKEYISKSVDSLLAKFPPPENYIPSKQ